MILTPSMYEILNAAVKPTDGEEELLRKLELLDDSYEVFFQSYLNGCNPDIIILKRYHGAFIIEVKDWNLNNYSYIADNNSFGHLFLNKNKSMIKTPFEQVSYYKKMMYNLYSDVIVSRNIENKKLYGKVKTSVYFYNSSESNAKYKFRTNYYDMKFVSIWGRDSNIIEQIQKNLRRNNEFTDEIYNEFKRILTPIYHKANEGRNIILSKRQLELSKSIPNKKMKIKGVAGSSKSTILAHRAVNIVKRTNGRVLILTYNITLRNYLRDKISAVREGFAWEKFDIIHYHAFIKNAIQSNNIGIEDNIVNDDLNGGALNSLNKSMFVGKIKERNKYDGILIDEGQDFEKEWFHILKDAFLKENGEFIIMADEKQNIYNRELDSDKKVITNIDGRWNELKKSMRLGSKIKYIADDFQKQFFVNKYEIDKLSEEGLQVDLLEDIKYIYDINISYEQIFIKCMEYFREKNLNYNNVTMIAGEIENLRELEFFIRQNYLINCKTMFETKEEYEKNNLKNNPIELENLRRSRKFAFNANSGQIKLSTIHSFKGWEAETLIIILDEDNKNITSELLYTAITRSKSNLIIFNRGHQEYDKFFRDNKWVDIVENV